MSKSWNPFKTVFTRILAIISYHITRLISTNDTITLKYMQWISFMTFNRIHINLLVSLNHDYKLHKFSSMHLLEASLMHKFLRNFTLIIFFKRFWHIHWLCTKWNLHEYQNIGNHNLFFFFWFKMNSTSTKHSKLHAA